MEENEVLKSNTKNKILQILKYTQIPNIFIESMYKYTGAEVKVFYAICRKTIGWHKKSDRVSYSQIQEMTGIKNKGTVRKAIKILIKDTWINQRGNEKKGYTYDMNICSEKERSEPKENLDNFKSEEETVSINDTTKETTKRKERKSISSSTPKSSSLSLSSKPKPLKPALSKEERKQYEYLYDSPFHFNDRTIRKLLDAIKDYYADYTLDEYADWYNECYYRKNKDGDPGALIYSAITKDYILNDYAEWGQETAFV